MNYTVQLFGFSFFLRILATGQAQDSRAYQTEDVPLSRHLEAGNAIDAWKEVEKACNRFPRLTGETAGGFQRGDPRTAYHESWLVAAADKAQEFYTKYPEDNHALSAREPFGEAQDRDPMDGVSVGTRGACALQSN